MKDYSVNFVLLPMVLLTEMKLWHRWLRMTNDLEEAPDVPRYTSRGCKHSDRTDKRIKEIYEFEVASSCI